MTSTAYYEFERMVAQYVQTPAGSAAVAQAVRGSGNADWVRAFARAIEMPTDYTPTKLKFFSDHHGLAQSQAAGSGK